VLQESIGQRTQSLTALRWLSVLGDFDRTEERHVWNSEQFLPVTVHHISGEIAVQWSMDMLRVSVLQSITRSVGVGRAEFLRILMLPGTDESTGPALCQPAMPKLVISPSYTGVTRNVPTIQHKQRPTSPCLQAN
jgi:hypothetical protein